MQTTQLMQWVGGKIAIDNFTFNFSTPDTSSCKLRHELLYDLYWSILFRTLKKYSSLEEPLLLKLQLFIELRKYASSARQVILFWNSLERM